MKRIGRSTATDTRLEVTRAYDVRSCGNGLIVGSVRYAFVNGEGQWCIAIDLHNGMPAYGRAPGEFEPFEPAYGEPTWALPTVRPRPAWEATIIGVDLGTGDRTAVQLPNGNIIDYPCLTAPEAGEKIKPALPAPPTPGGDP